MAYDANTATGRVGIDQGVEEQAAWAEYEAMKYAGQVPKGAATTDAYQNFQASVGLGTDNNLSGSTYGFNPITRIRTLVEWIYRGSWIGGIAIDIIADDMTRGGIEILSTMPPEDVEKLQLGLVSRGVWGQINDAIKWARLYGGAIAVMMIDGHDASQPLDVDRIGPDAFKGLLVLDRWQVQPSLEDLVTELGPDIGQPKYYTVVAEAPAFRGRKIHYSRVLRLEGIKLPYWQRVMENMWGLSIFERLYDRLVAFDSATLGMAQLCFKAYIRTFKFKGLRAALSQGGEGELLIARMLQMNRRFGHNEGVMAIDMGDEFVPSAQTTFTGISDAVWQIAQQLSGALQMPITRMFGQSPAGLNATGESDLRTYYDGIQQKQESELRLGFTRILLVLAKSLRIKLPDNFSFVFRSLWQLSEVEKSEIFSRDAAAINDLEAGGLITLMTALKELRQLSRTTGRMSNITDEEIDDAQDAPPRPREMEGAAGGPEDNEAGKAQASKGATADAVTRVGSEIEFHGMPIIVETEAGQERFGRQCPATYGYIRRTKSAEANQQMDCFVRDGAGVYVIDSYDGDRFDEHKVMLGYETPAAAMDDFLGAYSGYRIGRAITPMTIEQLTAWLATADLSAPCARTPQLRIA